MAQEVFTYEIRGKTDSFDNAVRGAAKNAGHFDSAIKGTTGHMHMMQSKAHQLGFALNDIASQTDGFAGAVRGASNNIQMMAAGLGGTAFIAITAATVAVTAFSDQIEEAFTIKGVRSVDTYKKALDQLLDIQIKAFDTKFLITNLAQLEIAIAAIGRRVGELDSQGMNALDAFVSKWLVLLPAKIPGMESFINSIAAPGGTTEELRAKLEATNRRRALEGMAKELGLTKEQIEVYKELFGIFEEAGLPTKGGPVDHLTQRMIDLNKEVRENRELLEALKGPYGDQIADLEAYNKRLERRIAFEQRIGQIQEGMIQHAKPAALAQGGSRFARESERQNPQPTDWLFLNALGQWEVQELPASFLRGAGDRVETETDAFVVRAVAAQTEISAVMADFGPAIAGGIASAAVDLATGTAGFSQVLGGFLSSLGDSLIAAGTAGIAIKTFIADPFAAIAAGIGLKIIGGLLAASAQQQTDRFASTTSGIGGGHTFAPGRSFASTQAYTYGGAYNAPQRIVVEVEGVTKGEDIYWTQRRVQRRHSMAGRR
jgi:hypothetical protein